MHVLTDASPSQRRNETWLAHLMAVWSWQWEGFTKLSSAQELVCSDTALDLCSHDLDCVAREKGCCPAWADL